YTLFYSEQVRSNTCIKNIIKTYFSKTRYQLACKRCAWLITKLFPDSNTYCWGQLNNHTLLIITKGLPYILNLIRLSDCSYWANYSTLTTVCAVYGIKG